MLRLLNNAEPLTAAVKNRMLKASATVRGGMKSYVPVARCNTSSEISMINPSLRQNSIRAAARCVSS